jgi:hypothetical protein
VLPGLKSACKKKLPKYSTDLIQLNSLLAARWTNTAKNTSKDTAAFF